MIEALQKQAINDQNTGIGELILLPYDDDQLAYRNGHTHLTEGVHGAREALLLGRMKILVAQSAAN